MNLIFKFDPSVDVREVGTITVQVMNIQGAHTAKVWLTTESKKDTYFRQLVQHPDPDKLMERLHALIDRRKGAAVGSVLLKCVQLNYLSKAPTQAEFCSEFQLTGTWSAIHNYMDTNSTKALARANGIIIF